MFAQDMFENSRGDGFPVLEVVAPDGSPDVTRRFVPLRRSELTGRVTGPLAQLCLTQQFSYSREECDLTLEALYRFPLPGDAAVMGVTVTFGEVEIRAELKQREQAERDYTEAVAAGHQAALATRESADVFTLRLAGIIPDEEVRVATSYVQLARAEGPGWSLRVPLTTAPRYVRSDEYGTRPAQGQPLALLRDPGHRFALDLTFEAAGEVSSPTHPLTCTVLDEQIQVQLQDGEVVPDRDCVIAWTPVSEEERPALRVTLHADPEGRSLYFLALVAPPRGERRPRPLPREVILLVDHSGSMEGAKWAASDWAVTRFVSGLQEQDTFSLGLFHHNTRWLSRSVLPGDAINRQRALEFLNTHRDSGGTELGVALEQALGIPPADGGRARHVLIVTDAEVSDSGRILRLAEQKGSAARRRISVLCIDAAPNSLLAHELAERGGGTARFLTSDPEQDDITTALDEVLADWASPILGNLRLQVNRHGVQTAGRDVEFTPGNSSIDLGDLPSGRALWVAGRIPDWDGASVSFRLTTGPETVAVSSLAGGETTENPGIRSLFGARRVLALEFLMNSYRDARETWESLERLGYDAKSLGVSPHGQPGKVYGENQRDELRECLKNALAKEALAFGIASAETAFVAVRSEAGKPVEATALVANAVPAGWGTFGKLSSGVKCKRVSMLCEDDPGDMYDLSPAPSAPAFSSSGQFFRIESAAPTRTTRTPTVEVWNGAPSLAGREAVLFDTGGGASELPESATLSEISLRFPGGTPRADQLDAGLCLLLFVGDLAVPRARIRITDLALQGGKRPLNLRYAKGQLIRLVLSDPQGAWAAGAPVIEVTLSW